MFPHIDTVYVSHSQGMYYKFCNYGYRQGKKLKWRYLFFKIKMENNGFD